MDDEDDIAEGEYIELGEDEETDVEETDDGGAVVTLGEGKRRTDDFYANLAEDMDERQLDRLAAQFIDLADVHVKEGVQTLEAAGLLAAGRAAEIINAPVAAEELP